MAFNRSAFHSKRQRKLRGKKIAEKLGAEETGILAEIWGLREEKIKKASGEEMRNGRVQLEEAKKSWNEIEDM